MKRDVDVFRPWSVPARTGNRDIFSIFSDLFSPNDFGRGFTPAVDIDEVDNAYLVSVDLPGVKESNVIVNVDGNQLSIRAERHDEKSDKKRNRNFSERYYGSFERTFTLPMNADVEKIECDFDNGVLRVAIPKGDASKSKKIEVKRKSGGLLDRLLGKSKSQDDEGGSNLRRASNL